MKNKTIQQIMLALALQGGLSGCANVETDELLLEDESGYSSEKITSTEDVSEVKRQSIGNCWLYAVASYFETLNKSATDKEMNISESYWTFWHWFEELANDIPGDEIQTGGFDSTAFAITTRYGIMLEKDFIPEEATKEMSARQSSALNAMNAWLKTKPFQAAGAPRRGTKAYRKFVLDQLKKAWQLKPEVNAKLDAVFGDSVTKTLDRSYKTKKPGNDILRSRDVLVRIPDVAASRRDKKIVLSSRLTLKDLIEGANAMTRDNYYRGDREFWQAVQRSLHAGVPVLSSWFVDFNALTSNARFSKAEVERRGVGRQGGHMTIMVDYAARTADGKEYKTGETVTEPEILKQLEQSSTAFLGVQMKNSWGAIRPDRWQEAQIPGYHFLEMDYIDGPLKRCSETATGGTDPDNCYETTGMNTIRISPIFFEELK